MSQTPQDPGADVSAASDDRTRLSSVRTRVGAARERGQSWVEQQDPSSRPGVAIEAWRRYRAVDGPLQSALLSLYILVAVIPALLVMEEYLERNPGALADHIVRHYRLSTDTATLLRGVLVHIRHHELGTALLAIAGALFFGVGFGRVLQLIHVRAWRLELKSTGTDFARYGIVLLGVYGLIVVLMVQLAELSGHPAWIGYALVPGWVALLTLFFVWVPRLLTHRLISARDLLPAAALTAVGIVVLMLVSRFVMERWVDFYASDYGGFGVVMAIFFWIAFISAIIVWAASLSPALAQRRDLREGHGLGGEPNA
jgi:membrane protein